MHDRRHQVWLGLLQWKDVHMMPNSRIASLLLPEVLPSPTSDVI